MTETQFHCQGCATLFADTLDEHGRSTVIAHSMTCGPLTPVEVDVPRFKVGDRVRLHHAKSKARKSGVVVEVRKTRMVVEVASATQDYRHGFLTERRIDDPDVLPVITERTDQ